MKKTVLFAISLLTSLGSMAEDNLAVENVTIPQGGTAVIAVNLNNPDVAYAAFQFRLTTATGIAVASDASDKFLVEKGSRINTSAFDDFSITTTAVNATTYDLLAWQLQTTAFPGTSGTIVNITLQADASLAVGSSHQCTLSEVQLSDTESNSYDLSDVSFTVTIGEQEDGRVVLDENSETAPETSDGEVEVRVLRTIKADEWSTICLPFEMSEEQLKAAFGDDVQLEEFIDYEIDDEDNITINFEDVDLSYGFWANYPYLIKTSNNITEFTTTAVIDPNPDNAIARYDNGRVPTHPRYELYGSFTGVYQANTVVPENCLFISGNKFWYSTGNTKMKAFRGYFWLQDVLSDVEQAGARISFNFNEATGISDNNREIITNDCYYDLQGRSVQTPVRKGLYINNGKKVVVK